MNKVQGYGTNNPQTPLAPFTFERRDPGPQDIQLDILYCGVCHSDLHQVRNEWHNTLYPCVPGHEIIGRVTKAGSKVSKFKEGDMAGVGCLVDSCRTCPSCQEGLEQYCENGMVFTYNGVDKQRGGHTFGGYSENIVVDESFVLQLPKGLDPAATAPLLCAGITTYSPLRHWNIRKGQKVGVVGLGGLGHMGLKFASAFGADVVLFTTSPDKTDDAIRFGAKEVVLSKDKNAMKKHAGTFDYILDTVSANHDINAYLELLKRDGTLTMVGAPEKPIPVVGFNLLLKRRKLGGSLIGGIKETQEMLDFCGEHGITCDVEMIRMDQINEAFERLLKSDVKYRFVIDMALKK